MQYSQNKFLDNIGLKERIIKSLKLLYCYIIFGRYMKKKNSSVRLLELYLQLVENNKPIKTSDIAKKYNVSTKTINQNLKLYLSDQKEDE